MHRYTGHPRVPGTFSPLSRFCTLKHSGIAVAVTALHMAAGAAVREEARDKQALFERYALVHKDHLYTACLSLTRRREEADDLFQDTYLRAYRSFHQFTPGTNCRAWLLTIMHNAFKNRYPERLRAARTVALDTVAGEYERTPGRAGAAACDDPAALLATQTLDREVADALRALPEEYRATFVLVDLEELTYEEAARLLGCPLGTVRSRLSRARRCLRTALARYAQERRYVKTEQSGQPEHRLPPLGRPHDV